MNICKIKAIIRKKKKGFEKPPANTSSEIKECVQKICPVISLFLKITKVIIILIFYYVNLIIGVLWKN